MSSLPPAPSGPPDPGPQHPPTPLVYTGDGSAGFVAAVGAVTLALGLLCLVQVFAGGIDGGSTRGRIGAAVLAVIVGGFGAVMLASYRNVKAAGLEIGAEGVVILRRKLAVFIRWSELAEVGISVLNSGSASSSPLAATRPGRAVIRIRLAPLAPEFGGRGDLDFLKTADEPPPYTHKIVLPKRLAAAMKMARLDPDVEIPAAALRRFAGAKFTGVEYRQVLVGRYS